MESIDHIRDHLRKSRDRVLLKIEDMRDHAFVAPTPQGGGHTLWVLGHLAYIEGLVIRQFMLGEDNPLADYEHPFDGDDVPADPAEYPPFDDVLARCRDMREQTLIVIDSLEEIELDQESAVVPEGFEDTFGTYRLCLQMVSDHWYMHRGQLAAARRAAQVDRMWV